MEWLLTGALREEVANLPAARGDRSLAFGLLRDEAPPPEPPHPERGLEPAGSRSK